MHSLRWRFIIPYAAILIITLGGLGIYLSQFVRDSYLNFRRSSLLSETRLVSTQIAPLIQAGPPYIGLQDLVKQYSSQLNVRMTVILPDGRVIGDSDADIATMENHSNRPEVQKALQKQEDTEIRKSGTLNLQMLYAAVPILYNSKIYGVARLSVSLEALDANIAIVQRATIGVTLLAILLGIALTFLLTGYTTGPLQRLTTAAQNMSLGEFKELPPASGNDEISLLNQAFNRMAIELNGKIGELETERGKLSAVLANMSDGVLIVDENLAVQLINPAAARVFQVSSEESIGRSLIEVARQHQLVEMCRRSQSTGSQQSLTLETSLEKLFVQAITTPLEHVLPGSILVLLQDLTRVRRLETVRRDFISNVSHELRTPLASLKALAETLQEGALEDPPAARNFLLRMEGEIDTLTQLVAELLELSRIESGRVPLEKQSIAPADLVHRAVERMQLQAERAGLSLRLEMPENLPLVKADLNRMAQVLMNLLHNAIKFTRPGGKITISAYPEGLNVVFLVRDTGVGISYEELPRIFERFYKADRARSGGGTGLGLSIARHLVEAHGGRIWAESTPGEGSTFYFSLPAVPD